MNLHIVNSNSMGNAYVLEASNDEALLIECGVRFEKIKQTLAFRLNRVAGCILTHEHGDHAKAIKDILSAGINVFASAGTHEACGTANHHRTKVVSGGKIFTAGAFRIMAFDVKHDVKEPLGFLISHPECGNVLFLTDTYYTEYMFRNLNNIIIEANYCQNIINNRLASGSNPIFLRDRVIQSHMSLDTCRKTLLANDLSRVNNIVLIHLSDGNSNAVQFKKTIQQATGKNVHVAEKGMTIPFNKTPF